jgi:hypothetical protein
MPGISVITITPGPAPATSTALVTPSSVISRRWKSPSGSSCFIDRFGIAQLLGGGALRIAISGENH